MRDISLATDLASWYLVASAFLWFIGVFIDTGKAEGTLTPVYYLVGVVGAVVGAWMAFILVSASTALVVAYLAWIIICLLLKALASVS